MSAVIARLAGYQGLEQNSVLSREDLCRSPHFTACTHQCGNYGQTCRCARPGCCRSTKIPLRALIVACQATPPAIAAEHEGGQLGMPVKFDPECGRLAPDLESHRARMREAFGDTLSDEFVEVLLGKLIEALRPSPFDQLEEATLNAGLVLIESIRPRSEMEALMAVQIVATGLSGLRFLRQSQTHMTEDYIDVYGSYAIKLLKLQAELLRALDRHRRGNRQTVEVKHVHLYPGSQGVVGIVNPPQGQG